MLMSLILVLLTRASALFLGRRFFCWRMAVMVGSRSHQSHHCLPTIEETLSRLYDPPLREWQSDLRVSGWIFSTIKLAFRQLNSILFDADMHAPLAKPAPCEC